MNEAYDRRQRPDNWPQRKAWNPAELPGWYLQLLGEVAGSLTAWRDHHPPQQLDPRMDPRRPADQSRRNRRHANG